MTVQHESYWNRMVPELTVTDFTASLYFYTEVLDFKIMVRRSDPEFAYINLGEAQLMLEEYHAGGWNTAELVKPLGRGVNFQIEVDDVGCVLAQVRKHGVPLYRDLRGNTYQIGETTACQKEFLIQDPDGYLLRFSQFIE